MNQAPHAPVRGDDDSNGIDEYGDGQTPSDSVTVPRKFLLGWLLAAAALGSVLTAAGVMVIMHMLAQEEVSHLEKAVAQLTKEKLAASRQYDELSKAHARILAERRCEASDGLDDCLAAGLARPERFAEADRQVLESRRAAKSATVAAENPSAAKTAAGTTEKISIGEFVQALQKIPGVAIDGNAAEKGEGSAPDPKGKKHSGKPAS